MTLALKSSRFPVRTLFIAFAVAGAAACSADQSGPAPSSPANQAGDSEVALTIRTAATEMRDGNLAEAGRLLDDARADDPENPAIWTAIARLRFRGGEHLSAIEAADRALELGPGYAPALLMRGQLVRDANGLYESLVWFEAAVEADPNHAEAVGEYAATLGDLGQHVDMLKAVQALAEIDAESDQALYLQAVLAARAGKPILAQSLLERSNWREVGIPSAMLLGAVIDMQQGNADTAAETLAQLGQRQPANTRVRDLYALALWNAGRDEKLIAQMSQAIEQPGASAYLIMLVGRAHERLGDRAAAAPLISKAYGAQKTDWHVLPSKGALGGTLPNATVQIRSRIAAGDTSGAGAQAALLTTQFEQSSDFRSLAGDAALARDDATDALAQYSVSAKVRRPWPLTRKIAAALRKAQQGRAADNLLSRYTLGDPRNADSVIALMLSANAAEEWERVAQLADYAIMLGAGQDRLVLAARIDAARAMGDDGDAELFAQLLQAVQPAQLVRD